MKMNINNECIFSMLSLSIIHVRLKAQCMKHYKSTQPNLHYTALYPSLFCTCIHTHTQSLYPPPPPPSNHQWRCLQHMKKQKRKTGNKQYTYSFQYLQEGCSSSEEAEAKTNVLRCFQLWERLAFLVNTSKMELAIWNGTILSLFM